MPTAEQDNNTTELAPPVEATSVALRHPPQFNPLLLRGRFPKDLDTPEALQEFMSVCVNTGLNPFLGEVVPIHGRVYVTEAGWLRLIDQRRPNTLLADEVRLGTEEEARELGITGSGWLAIARVIRLLDTSLGPVERSVIDRAFLSAEAVRSSRVSAVKDEPWRQAFKIARVRALRRAYPDVVYECAASAPAPVWVDEEDFVDLPETPEDPTIERSRFWARCREYGIANGSQALANLLGLPEAGVGAMKKHWLDAGRSWYDANDALDRWVATTQDGGQ